MEGFILPLVGVPLPNVLGYFLSVIALWGILGRLYPVLSFLRKYTNFIPLHSRCGAGSWAVVTGASYGIGLGFVKALAAKGFHIVLVARSKDTMRQIAEDIERQFHIKTRVVCWDFSHPGTDYEDFYHRFTAEIEDLDVSVLVNNVGTSEHIFFEDQTEDKITEILQVNIWPGLVLTRWALEKMRLRRSQSAIINVTSMAAVFPTGGVSVYSASKQFIDKLTLCLSHETDSDSELRDKLHIICFRPGIVRTPLAEKVGQTDEPLTISIEECAEAALEHVGTARYTMGHWKHRLVRFIVGLLPDRIRARHFIDKIQK